MLHVGNDERHFSLSISQELSIEDGASAVAIPDTHLLLNGDFKRAGDDLRLISADGKIHVIAGYFKSDNLHALRSPDGATLTGRIVAALAGPGAPGQYAATDAPSPAMQVIGHAVRIEGQVTVLRNGVVVALDNGAVVLRGDVVQTGSDGIAGLVFNDGSAFQIGHGSRLSLTEFRFDPQSSANVETFDLLEGSFSFASGKIAHSGEMRIGTPVASAKIAGSVGGAQVSPDDGSFTLSIFDQHDGQHQATTYDRNGNAIATVSSDGGRLTLKPSGTDQFTTSEQFKTDADKAGEQDALNSILQIQNLGDRNGSAPRDGTGKPGSSSPPGPSDPGSGGPSFQPGSPDHGPASNVAVDAAFQPGSAGAGGGGGPPANRAPVIGAAQTAVTVQEDAALDIHGRLHTDGTIAFTDLDPSDAHVVSVSFVGSTRAGGLPLGTMDAHLASDTANGLGGQATWRYLVDDADVQFLRAGQTVTETYAVTIGDGHGGLASRNVTVTITGEEDAPVLAAASAGTREETDAAAQHATLRGALAVTDPDIGDTLTASIVNAPVVTLDGHAFTLPAGAASLIGNALSFHQTTSNGGTAGIDWTYDPSAANLDFLREGQSLVVTYTVEVSDGLLTSQQTLTITVTGTNDVPVVSGDAAATDEAADASAQAISLTGAISVSDPDVGDTLTASVVGAPVVSLDGHAFTLPAGALALTDSSAFALDAAPHLSTGGTTSFGWTYQPGAADLDFLREGQTLTLTYAVAVNDGTATSATQYVTVTINGKNDAPVVTGDSAATDEAADAHAQAISLSGAISASDRDVGDTLTASVVGAPVVSLDGHAFTLPAGAQALADSAAFALDATSQPSTGGTTTFGWTYQPGTADLDFLKDGQTLTLTYAVAVGDGTTTSATQFVTITIDGKNDAPVAVGHSYVTDEDHPLVVPATGVLTGASDLDGDALHAILVNGPAHGTLTLNGDGSFSYAPAADYNGNDSFTYKINDGLADSDVATVDIVVQAVNDPAVIAGTTRGSVTEAGGVGNAVAGTPSATGTLTDSDVDNPADTFTAVTTPAASTGHYGTYTIDAGGAWTYTLDNDNPAVQALRAGGTLTDTFTAATADGTPQQVTITITGANDAAVLSADTVNLDETDAVPSTGGTLTIHDPDSPQIFVAQPGTAGHYGTFTIDANGAWTYVASSAHDEFVGGQTYTDTFSVASADGTTSSVTINILGSDDPARMTGTTTGTVTEAGGVANAVAGTPTATGTLTLVDVDTPSDTFVAVATPTASTGGYGTYTVSPAGAWSYTLDNDNPAVQALAAGATMTDTFSVMATDGTAKPITITITGTNDAAVLSADTVNLDETDSVLSTGGTLTIHDVDSPQTFVAQTGTLGQYGTFTIGTDGVWTYVATSAHNEFVDGQIYTDTFSVASADGTTSSVTINIRGSNDAASISGSSSGSVTEAGGVANAVAGTPSVTGTLVSIDADNLNTFAAVLTQTGSTGGYGTYTINSAGVWTYTLDNDNPTVQGLNAGGTLTDNFTVTTADGTPQQVTITINGANDAAVLSAATVNLGETDAVLSTGGTLTIHDVDSPETFVAQTGTVGHYGTFTIDADGAWTYVASSAHNEFVGGQTYTDTFTVASADGTATSVTINILGSNDAASISGTSTGTVTEAGGLNNAVAGTPSATGTLAASDVDNPGTFTPVLTQTASIGGYGTYTMTAAGVWTYTLDNSNPTVQGLNAGATLTDTFTVTTVDGTAQRVTITINGTDDAAVIPAVTLNLAETDAPLSTGGTLTIQDPDSPQSFVAQPGTAGLYGTFTLATEGTWTYVASSAHDDFVGGRTYTDTFSVASADGTTSSVTVNILGTDDPASMTGPSTGSVTEAGGIANAAPGIPGATGRLTLFDPDTSTVTFVTVPTPTASAGGYGTYTVSAGGVWSYTLDNNNTAVQALKAGAVLTDTFSVAASDGSTQLVTITINGTNDAPVLSGDGAAALLQGLSTAITTADISLSDVDNSASELTFNVSGTSHGYVALSSAPGVAITSFTQAQLAAGQVIFVNDGTLDPSASFTVYGTDGSAVTGSLTVNVAVTNDFVLPGNIDLGGVSETIHSLTQSGGTLSGTGTLTDANGATFTGGTESGSGTTIVNGLAKFFDANNETFTLDGRALVLHGSGQTGVFSGDTLRLNNGANFKIDAGVTFTDSTASGTGFNIASSAGTGSVTVAGNYDKAGPGTTIISTALANSGVIDAKAGTLDLAGNVTNTGTLQAEGGGKLLVAGNLSGSGAVTVGNGGTVEFGASVASGQTVTFNGASATLKLDAPASFGGTIAGFSSATDAIDLAGINYNSGQFSQSFNSATGVLHVTDGTRSADLHFSGPTYGFAFSSDGAGGTLIKPSNVYVVHNAAELNTALLAVSVGGAASAANTNYSIEFANDISVTSLGSNLTAINLASGSSLAIHGAGHALDGGNAYRGLFVYGGNVTIDNLAINHMVAQGGAGGKQGGGGGAGLGGGLFIASGATVAISNVSFSADKAIGGAGGGNGGGDNLGGGGGGMGSAGIANTGQYRHTYTPPDPAHISYIATAVDGTAGGGVGLNIPGRAYLLNGGTGAHWFGQYDGFRSSAPAGTGGFGGGGGGGFYGYTDNITFAQTGSVDHIAVVGTNGGAGGFGGGGGGGSSGHGSHITHSTGGAGGFGGGGGGGYFGGGGGYGGGQGGGRNGQYGALGAGGGGLGAGGDIFVQEGGHLVVGAGSLSGGSVTGGAAGEIATTAQAGKGLGSGIFIQGNQTITFAPAAGDDLTIADVIADQHGNGGTGNVLITGGTVHFAGANSYVGTTVVNAGATLNIDAGGAPGTGTVTANGVLNVNTATTFAGAVNDGGVLNVNAATTFSGAVNDSGILNVNAATNFAAAVVDTGVLNVNAVTTFASTVTNSATLNVNAATIFASTVTDNGTLNVNAAATFQGTFVDNGTVNVNSGVADFGGSFTGNGTIYFGAATSGTAVFEQGVPTQTIVGFSNGDVVDLRTVVATTVSVGAGNVVTLKDAGGATVATLHFDPAQTLGPFGVTSDGHGGTNLAAIQTTFNVGTAAELSAALAAISQGGTSYAKNIAYTIHFTGDISLAPLAANAQLAAINLDTGSSLLVDGAGFTLDGANAHRGFFEYAGNVKIQHLTIANMLAQGGNGAIGGGGGGAGLGGGLFVAAGATVTISDVAFRYNAAHGGNGGGVNPAAGFVQGGGGGGGMGIDGAPGSTTSVSHQNGRGYAGGTGGGLGLSNLAGGSGAGATSFRGSFPSSGTFGGGGGGGGGYIAGRIDGSPGAQGGFGAGGGAGGGYFPLYTYGSGANSAGGNGGFGGGGGGGGLQGRIWAGQGGFGAGNGSVSIAYRAGGYYQAKIGNVGGGGLGAGGGVFVQEGGSLIIESGSLSGGSVAGGAAGAIQAAHQLYMPGAGQGLGSGIFLQGNQTLTFAPTLGATVTVADVIADQGGNGGRGAVDVKGAGIVEFDAVNTYSGGTTIEAGATLTLGAGGTMGTGTITNYGTLHLAHATTVANAIADNGDILVDGSESYTFTSAISGSGTITFGSGSTTLAFNGNAPTQVIHGFGVGDAVDLKTVAATGIGSYANGILTLTDAGGAVVGTLNFDPAQGDLVTTGFRVVPDGSGGTYVVLNGIQTTFEVSTYAELQTALKSINNGGTNSATNTAYTINIHANLALTQYIPAIDLAAGDTLAINGLGHTIDGGVNGVATYSGFYLRSGDVTLSDLTIQNTVQRGGDGTGDPHSRNGGGGGGLGAGGGLFVGAGASATLDNISFIGDQAIGGNGGRGYGAAPPQDTDVGRGGLFQGRYNYNNGYGGFGTGGRGSNGFIGAGNGHFGAGAGGGASRFSNNPYGLHSPGQDGGIGGYAGGTGGTGQWPGNLGGGGGGGAGLGGAIFVMAGGSLSVSNGSLSGNNAIGGGGGSGGLSGSAGQGLGGAFFNNGSEIALTSTAGKTLRIEDSIAGTGTLDLEGPGNFTLLGAISGSQTINISGSGDVILAGPISGSEIINITGSGDVTVTGSITGSETINVAGSGDVILQGPITGTEHITYTGTGSLTLPIANVASGGDLVVAITDINIGGKLSIARVHYHEIDLTQDVPLQGGIPALNLAAGDTLTVKTAGHLLDGAHNGAGGDFNFAATASGGGAVLLGNAIPTFDVANVSQLVTAFNTINVGGLFSSPNINYVINLGGDTALGSLSAGMLNFAAGDTLTINTNGHTLNGAVNGNGSSFTFATGASMGPPAFTGHPVAVFTVGSIAEYNAALAAINPGGFYYGTNIDYEIDLTADLKLTGNMAPIQLAAGDTLTIKGGGHSIDGSVNGVATYSGFDLESGNLALSNLTIKGTVAHGHDGGSVGHRYAAAGGGGAGLGGGLFIGAGTSATLDGVAFTGNSAIGGSGGTSGVGPGYNSYVGGGGPGSPSSGFGIGGAGGWGRQPAFYAHSRSNGLAGGFGGGGGGGSSVYRVIPKTAPFFAGELYIGIGGSGGYGAGNGGNGGLKTASGGGGGGAGLGGGVFVSPGATLTITGGSIAGNSAVGGSGGFSYGNPGSSGQGIGSGLFTASSSVTLAPSLGKTLTISDTIAGGGIGVVHVAGAGNVTLSGAITGTTIDISSTGTVLLPTGDLVNDSFSTSGSAHFTLANKITGGGSISASGTSVLTITGLNLLTGGMVLSGSSTIDLTSVNSIGSGVITFAPNAGATLVIEQGVTFSNQINSFNPGDAIKLVGFGANATATLGAGNVLTVTDGVHSIDLHLNPGANYSLFTFNVTPYSGGVTVTDSVPFGITGSIGQPVYGTGAHLIGTATPGSTVTIIANGGTTVLGTGIVDGNGNFDLITSPLTDGIYTFQAVMQTGTTSQTSAGFVVNVIPTAPAITTQIGAPLNGDTVELKGTALPGQTVKLYLDGSSTAFATGVADANGNFDIVTPALIDGSHTIRATDTNSQGLTSALSAGFTVNVNPTAPTLTAVVNSPFNAGPITVKGTGEANRIIKIYADGGATVLGTGSTDGNGNFSFSTSSGLSNGVHTLTAVTVNGSLSSTVSNNLSVTVVPSAPAITTLVGQPDNGSTIEVKGTGQPNQTVTLYADGGTTAVGTGTIDATGHFDITTTLTFADGVHRLTATATDSSNFVSPLSSQFTVNVIPDAPVISAVIPVSGTTQRIEVQGTGEVGETIKLYADGSTTVLATGVVDATGHFDIFVNILGGTHTIRATETNSANLVSVISTGVSVNVTPTAPVITALIGQPINGTTVTVKGTAQHVGGTITLYADGGTTVVGTGTVAANGTFSITTSVTFADAVHTFTAVETDDGIASAPSSSFTVNVNPIAPTITSQVGTTVEGGALEFVGTGEVGNVVTIKLGAVTIGSGTVDATGHFDITTSPVANPGAQIVTLTETNAANLTSTASSFVATVAPVAPVITSVVSVTDPGGRVEVFGTGKAGDVVKLYADGGTTVIGTGTVDVTGHFAIYSTMDVALGAGTHGITATQTLVNGVGSATSPASAASNVSVVTTPNSFTITSAADLSAAIAAIDLTGAHSHPDTHYTFNIVGDLALTDQLPAFNLASGDTLTIHGNGHTLDASGFPGLFVYAGTLDIDNLSVVNAVAKGGDSAGQSSYGGGGGGAGLGGGLFIASAGAVNLDNVSFVHDSAVGGNGSYFSYAYGGGGGMGGAGNLTGGGGVGRSAFGGYFQFGYVGRGIIVGAASGGSVPGGSAGGANGGGGGSALGYNGRYTDFGGAGGGVGGSSSISSSGGAGGFGGGGGGAVINGAHGVGGAGGFGGGGGAGRYGGGAGGFGGGGGGGGAYTGGAGGFGAGNGIGGYRGGGGGLGAGGAIFVQEGGSLTFGGSGGAQGGSATGGDGSSVYYYHNSGSGLGSGIFLQGNQSMTFAPGAARSITISDVIADMTGSHDASGQTGEGRLVLDGEGTLVLGATNTFTGGVTIENGTLDLTASGAAGSGAIDFSASHHATLEFSATKAPVNTLQHFGTSDQIVIDGFHATSESYSGGVLVLNSATGSVSLNVSGEDITSLSDFHFAYDSVANTTTITAGPDRSGNDVVHYGAGAHSLTGGMGDDVFFFRDTDLSAGVTNRITDLSWATGSGEHDRIHLEGVDPNAVTVTSVNGGHDTDIAISLAGGGTSHILVQGTGSGPLQIEFQNTNPTDDAHLNNLLTPSNASETIASFYLGANAPYAESMVSYDANGAVIAQDVTNNDGSHTVTVQGANAALAASAAADTFAFQFNAPSAAAAVTIDGFDVASDVLKLSQSVYADAAAALAAIAADPHNAGNPADTFIALDGLHSVTLVGVDPHLLQQRDFLVV
ncbi:VCBS domain-containing protein [Bradyrhizobium diazoefficiens]|nr:VCBS domain-containing protein [Bradyrhizobium diazoefficiens]MBR0778071.1 VCBS domain-containing protein [Bradyrhizobium diazoefficiens]